ncbi:MAG: GNAT family N-acetyltransferase [Acidobacteriia bacterium]|nr:GNAT family N-acetyltransferase [Terriglobia bacterium]
MGLDILIREATLDDIPEILRHRRCMYEDMDYREPQPLAAMVATSEQYLAQALANRSFRAWFALAGMRVVGGGAVLISPWPSHPYDLECRRATILNLYVYPQFRRQGVARRLMQAMIEWCRSQDFATVSLHASADGRHLYEALGFKPTNEMRLALKP